MPSRKQRRRREKDKRHQYEYVYVDEHGRQVEVDEAAASPNGSPARAKDRPKAKSQPRGGRTVEPASWQRAGRRGLLFAPLMFGVLYLLNRDVAPLALAVNTLVLLAFFVPFGYFMDKVMYGMYLRRTGNADTRGRRRG